MIAYVLYSKDSPMERDVSHFVEQLDRLRVNSKAVESDSLEGASLTERYDLTSRPAIALVAGDGSLIERWQGALPMPEDISYLVYRS